MNNWLDRFADFMFSAPTEHIICKVWICIIGLLMVAVTLIQADKIWG
jgi:hypothetical protein